MKIILQREVEKLGVPGDVVVVADGYARNYLLPRGMAVQATKGGIRHIESLKRAHEQRTAKSRREAEELAARLSAGPLRLRHKAGEGGRLFGSITAAELAEEINKQFDLVVDRRALSLAEPIKSVGSHEVTVHLQAEVTATVTVEVEGEE